MTALSSRYRVGDSIVISRDGKPYPTTILVIVDATDEHEGYLICAGWCEWWRLPSFLHAACEAAELDPGQKVALFCEQAPMAAS